MWRAPIREEESRLETEEQVKYKGTARIGLKWLFFPVNQPRVPDGRDQPRKPDDENVERLTSIFRKDCDRLEEQDHILAVIEQQVLDAAIELWGDLRAATERLERVPGAGFSALLSVGVPSCTGPNPGCEGIGIGVVGGGSLPRRHGWPFP